MYEDRKSKFEKNGKFQDGTNLKKLKNWYGKVRNFMKLEISRKFRAESFKKLKN